MKRAFLLLIALYSLACLIAPLSQAATIRINTPKILLELAPGETYTGEIVAENPESEEIKAKIYLEDWTYKPGGTGEKQFMPIAGAPLSASKWINFSPPEAVFKPFGRVVIRYTVTVPQDVKGGYYSVLFIETLLGTTTDEEGVSVNVTGRIGALFFIEIKGTADRRGEIKSVELVAPQGNQPMEILTTFSNAGNVDIALGGNFLILDADGKIQGRGELNKIYTLPGGVETGKTQWVGRLAKGSYQVLMTYDLGKGKNLVEEKVLNVE